MPTCLYCGETLSGRQKKYCSELHRYRYLSIVNDKPRKFSRSQHLRIARAGKAQRKGRVGVRFN